MGNCIPKNTINEYIPEEGVSLADCQKFIAPIRYGRVVKVYDGDTITIAAYMEINKYGKVLYKFSCRLDGIDCPEMNSKNPSEKEVAIAARNFLSEIILGKVVELVNVKTEKYGRTLATVYFGKLNICQLMLDNKYAVEYDGGKKIVPVSWKRYNKTGSML